MNDIVDYSKNDLELRLALEHITEHVVNKDFYYRTAYSATKNLDIQKDLKNQNQRRSYYLQSNFNNSCLIGTGFADSIFKETTFNNCEIEHTSFESSYFFDCFFQNQKPYISTSFAQSFIYNSIFSNILFNRCRFSNISFHYTTIKDCSFDNTSFEGTAFNNTSLDHVFFKNLNLEYTRFNNVHINNTALPFPSMPFIINGISYFLNTTDDVSIKSAKKGRISREEYFELIPYLKTYYEKTNHYFPLANIYVAESNAAQAIESVQHGIYQAILLNNYKQLKYYCILVSSCELFNIHQKKAFAKLISKEFNKRLTENFNFYSPMANHLTELNNILFSNNQSSLIISFKTNISNNNYFAVQQFYRVLNLLIGTVGIESNYSVNFTYNSEAEIIATINSLDPSIVVALITACTTIFIAGIKGVANLPEVIKKFASVKYSLKKEKYESENKELENKKLQLEINNLKAELTSSNLKTEPLDQIIAEVKPILMSCDELKNAGVSVKDINYNALNLNTNSLAAYVKNLIFNTTSPGSD